MSDRSKSARKSFVFSEEASARLDALRVACRLDTDAAVLRRALAVLEDAVEHVGSGTIVFKDSAGKVVRPYHPLMTTGRGDNAIPPTGGEEPERKSFVFDEAAGKRLEALQRTCRQSSASNLIRLALVVLEDMSNQVLRGGKIEFVDAAGAIKPYSPLGMLITSEPRATSEPRTTATSFGAAPLQV